MYAPGPYEIDGELDAHDWGADVEIIAEDCVIARVIGLSKLSKFVSGNAFDFNSAQKQVLDTARLFKAAPDMAALFEKLAEADTKFLSDEDEKYPEEIMDLLEEVHVILARVKGV